ncbi:MAG: JAB domain-containing protein [Gemmatimonadota bacterium]
MASTRDHRTLAPAIHVSTRRVRFTVAPLAVHDAAPPIGDTVATPAATADVARAVIGSEISECLLAIFLDARRRVTGYSEVARGTINAAHIAPRDVLIPALHANAAAVIVAHNHPSNDSTPSDADRGATGSLRAAARLIGVPIVDHLIVTTDAVFSLRQDEGWED